MAMASREFSVLSNNERRNATIKIADIPEPIRSHALKLDKNQDGDLSIGELALAIDSLYRKKRKNDGLRKTVVGLVFVTILLIAGTFGATLAGAILSKEFEVDRKGFATVKNAPDKLMQTAEAIFFRKNTEIGQMTNQQLSDLVYITYNKQNLRLYVRGHARDRIMDRVIILVEGGTVTYDVNGLVDATGDAKIMLEYAMGLEEFDKYPSDRRWRKLQAPSTPSPTASTPSPTASTPSPTASTPSPTASTPSPTASTPSPTASPSSSPTASPTSSPTASPSSSPTASPSFSPTASPSFSPTASPTSSPTASPSSSPTASPSFSPTASPSLYKADVTIANVNVTASGTSATTDDGTGSTSANNTKSDD